MDPFIGEIRIFPWGWPPRGWMQCNGAILQIQQYSALYSLVGTKFGGDGQKTFGIPDLRGRTPAGFGGDTTFIGRQEGVETVTLTVTTMPAHGHVAYAATGAGTKAAPLANIPATPGDGGKGYGTIPIYRDETASGNKQTLAGDTVIETGSDQPHSNMQPSLVLNYCIASSGLYPSRE